MTRASAAIGDSRPRQERRATTPRTWGKGAIRALAAWGPTAPAILAAVLLIALFALTFVHLRSERERALSGAARDLDVFATALAERLDAALAASPGEAPADALRAVLAANPDLRPGRSLLADANGRGDRRRSARPGGQCAAGDAAWRRATHHPRRQGRGAEGAGRRRRRRIRRACAICAARPARSPSFRQSASCSGHGANRR